MPEKFDINPFDRSALKDYKLLAGRTNEFRKIRFHLRNSSKNLSRIKSVLITGNRGVGKTSFLNLIENESLDNNIISIRINLTETNSINSNEFFWYLFSQTIYTLFSLDLLNGKGGAIDTMVQKILHGDGLADQANWVFRTPILRKNYLINQNSQFEFDVFVEDLKLIRKEISDDSRFNEKTKIYFLVDESQHIYSNLKIIEDVRYVIQNQDIGIGFVFAGDTTYETSIWEDVFGGSYRDFEIINLNYFNDVDAVIDYFKKSLTSIGWSIDEIEDSLFYRFKLACRHIFQLTSGNPSWINTIASKMFERCMREESSILKFDRQAQNDVKFLLESSGKVDKIRLDIIDSLSMTKKKWLVELFACEAQTLGEVYYYGKFKLIGEDYLSTETYVDFCKYLVKHEILKLLDKEQIELENLELLDFLDRPYIAFDLKSDTIKQWLQINSDGKYKFGYDEPNSRYIKYINDALVLENFNSVMISNEINLTETPFRLATLINDINNSSFDVNEESYDFIFLVYKACKRLSKSKERQSLFAKLINNNSNRYHFWNIYNYDDKERAIGFNDLPKKIEKYRSVVNGFNDEKNNLELVIEIDKLDVPDLKRLQYLIIKSNDKKKFGIILDDKDSDLINAYIKHSDMESSYDTANFFYELFEEGHDLTIRNLNNAAYVFLAKNELEKSYKMLNEARNTMRYMQDIDSGAELVLYNLAIIDIKNRKYENALVGFKSVLDHCETLPNIDTGAGVLHLLEIDENNELTLIEKKDDNRRDMEINCKTFSQKNIEILTKYLNIN